jgi:S1-C subfamily serine protease
MLGIATAFEIRGLAVVIPASIAWATAATLLEHGGMKRGYLGVVGQGVRLSERQRGGHDREQALIVVGIAAGSPADTAGLIVGDVVLQFDGQPVESPEDLLDLLRGDRVGRTVPVRILRGGAAQDVSVTVGTRG